MFKNLEKILNNLQDQYFIDGFVPATGEIATQEDTIRSLLCELQKYCKVSNMDFFDLMNKARLDIHELDKNLPPHERLSMPHRVYYVVYTHEFGIDVLLAINPEQQERIALSLVRQWRDQFEIHEEISDKDALEKWSFLTGEKEDIFLESAVVHMDCV